MGNLRSIFLAIFFLGSYLFASLMAAEDSDFDLGVQALSQNDYESAILHFQNAINSSPSYEAYYNLGLSFYENGDVAAALWAMEYAYYLNPSSKDARFNATQILQQINTNKTWEDPFSSWTKFTVRIGTLFWLMLSILLSVSVGLFFFMASTTKQLTAKKQLFSALAVAGSLLMFTVIAGKQASNHFENDHFVLPKMMETSTYLSPDGLALDEVLILGKRYPILEKSGDWIKIAFEEEHPLWVNAEDVFYY
jgi:tetratricopeptide (TPR) repeat protein